MFSNRILFCKERFFAFRKLSCQTVSLTFVFIMILMMGFGQIAKAQPCTAASVNFCDIEFDEWVRDVPAGLRAALGLDPTENPVAVPRVARVWPGNGTLANPPVIVYNGGAGSTAWGNAHGAWALQFEVEWPEAIVVYTQATELTNHDGSWATGGHICWQPQIVLFPIVLDLFLCSKSEGDWFWTQARQGDFSLTGQIAYCPFRGLSKDRSK